MPGLSFNQIGFLMSEFFPVPEEVAKALREAQDHKEMHVQDYKHSLQRFLDSLNEDQMDTFRMILLGGIQTEGDSLHYLIGMCDQIGKAKFNFCLCGEKHDPNDLLGDEEDEAKSPTPEELTANHAAGLGEPSWIESDGPDLTDHDTYVMYCEQYNVVAGGMGNGKVFCNGCGAEYVSLEDRMLRKPGVEGCGGCQHKEKFG